MLLLVPQKCTTQCSGCNGHQPDTAKDTSNENTGTFKEACLVMGIEKYTKYMTSSIEVKPETVGFQRRGEIRYLHFPSPFPMPGAWKVPLPPLV